MGRRIKLQETLQSIIGVRPDGGKNVYFQPPSTVKMNHPCIVYSIEEGNSGVQFANNQLYFMRKAYTVTVIDPNPDSEIPDDMLSLPYCSFDRRFTVDNLNHSVFRLYY